MIIHVSNDERRTISLNVGTGIKHTNGKQYIYCDLSYYDKKAIRRYHKVFSPTRFDEVANMFYALHNGTIPTVDIPALFK